MCIFPERGELYFVTVMIDCDYYLYRYIETSQMSALEEVFISKANAKQRQGRAGRVQSGTCFRLYTKQMYVLMFSFVNDLLC